MTSRRNHWIQAARRRYVLYSFCLVAAFQLWRHPHRNLPGPFIGRGSEKKLRGFFQQRRVQDAYPGAENSPAGAGEEYRHKQDSCRLPLTKKYTQTRKRRVLVRTLLFVFSVLPRLPGKKGKRYSHISFFLSSEPFSVSVPFSDSPSISISSSGSKSSSAISINSSSSGFMEFSPVFPFSSDGL